MSDRQRNGLILAGVVGLILASLAVIVGVPGVLDARKTRLGLDLQGGVELVYQAKPTPQQPTITAEAMDRALDILRKRVDKLGVAEPEIQRSGTDQINIGLPAVRDADRAIEQVGKTAQLFFYDWEVNVIGPEGRPDPTNDEITDRPIPELYDAVLRASQRPAERDGDNTTNDQFYLFCTAPAGCEAGRKYSPRQLIIGPEDSEEDLFSELPGGRAPAGSQVLTLPTGTIVVQAEKPDRGPDDEPLPQSFDPGWFVLNDDPSLGGTDLRNPEQNFDQGAGGSGEPIVTFDFSAKGRRAFQEVTARIAQRGVAQQIPGQRPDDAYQHFAIVLDNELVSRPYINFQENPNGIDGRTGAQISGGFTIETAQTLADFLRIGALPVRLELISQSQVSATLGAEALDQALLAGIVGLSVVVAFLLAFYRVAGAIAIAALAVYGVYFYALIKLIPITMTLPGIAGMILTIGVASDANIVIFERVKEEVRSGTSIRGAIAAGYKKGFSSILDANVITLLTAFILFILATAGVKGFAFTLGVGTIVSLFTAVLATQAILTSMGRTRLLRRATSLGAGEQRHKFRFDYMGASRWFFSMSGVILLIGALSVSGKGLTFGIDFESGTRITTSLQRPATEAQVRAVLAAQGYADAKIQRVDRPDLGRRVVQVSTPSLQPAQVQDVRAALDERFGVGNGFSNQSIGPTFGRTVAQSALVAIIASLLVITAYIWMRFGWKYSVPVLIALMHDLLITAGVYSLAGLEVSSATVAALLTILGYSLYDTVIVFDRVRENVPRMPRAAFSQIMNRSMSEVLVRSLITGLSSALLTGCLLVFGGETLRAFAFALLVGIVSGTYSSIFIASPVLTHWKEREPAFKRCAAAIRRSSSDGRVPAYAPEKSVGGDETPRAPRRRLTTPERPGEISPQEFEALVKDLDVEPPARGARDAFGNAATPEPRDSDDGKGEGEGDGKGKGEGGPATPAKPPRPSRPKRPVGGSASKRPGKRHGRAR